MLDNQSCVSTFFCLGSSFYLRVFPLLKADLLKIFWPSWMLCFLFNSAPFPVLYVYIMSIRYNGTTVKFIFNVLSSCWVQGARTHSWQRSGTSWWRCTGRQHRHRYRNRTLHHLMTRCWGHLWSGCSNLCRLLWSEMKANTKKSDETLIVRHIPLENMAQIIH